MGGPQTDLAALRDALAKAERSAWDPWAEASWRRAKAFGDPPEDDRWSLAVRVSRAERDFIVACDPDTIRALIAELEALRAVATAARVVVGGLVRDEPFDPAKPGLSFWEVDRLRAALDAVEPPVRAGSER